MRLRIAIVTESFPPVFNGVANSVVRILETIQELGHEAIVIAPTTPGEFFNGFRTYQVPSVSVFQFQLGLPSAGVTKILTDFKPDLVHAASPVLLGAQAITWAERNQVPVVAVFQTDLAAYTERYGFKVLRPIMDKLLANVHAGATLNLAPNSEIKNYLHSIGLKNVEIWGRGVDLDLFHPNRRASADVDNLRSKIAPNGEKIVGYVGRLAAEKRVDRFTEFVGIDNTVLLIVGDGPERPTLESKLSKANVKFVGKQTGEDLANYYAAMDVFVHFGTEETFGQTIQEAQSSGVAVLAPNSGGPKYLIESGISGYLINPDLRNAYPRQLELLLKDDELRQRIAEGGRRSVLSKSWQANNSKLFEFYAKALAIHGVEMSEQVQVA